MKLDESFPANYEAEVKGEFDTPDGFVYVPARPKLIVEVRPKLERPWTDIFGASEGTFEDALTSAERRIQ